MTQTASFITVGINDPSADFNTADYASHDAAIQAAIDHAAAQGMGEVHLGAGTFENFARSVELQSNVTLRGAGEGVTVLRANLPYGDAIVSDPETVLENAGLASLTVDVGFGDHESGFKIFNFTNFELSDVTVENIGVGGWGAFFGVEDADTNADRNDGLTLTNLTVNNHQDSTLESVLIFNTNNVSGNIEINDRANGPGVGLWQNVDGADLTVVGTNVTGSGSTLLYYSFSTENLDLHVTGENVQALVQGGNESDHGLFGYTDIPNVNIYVSGTGTGQPGAGVQLGGINGGTIEVGTLSNFEVPILIDGGNATGGYEFLSSNFTLFGGTITDNNPGDDFHALHPAILIVGSGEMNAIISDMTLTSPNDTQRYPIAFEAASISNLIVMNSTLAPGTGGQSIQLNIGSSLGDGVAFVNIDSTVIVDGSLTPYFMDVAAHVQLSSYEDIALSYNGDAITTDVYGIYAESDVFAQGHDAAIVLSNSADIDAVQDGITGYANGAGDVSISNAGDITSDATGLRAHSAGGAIVIENTGDITTQGGDGIQVTSLGGAAVTNSGTISSAGIAVQLTQGDDVFTTTGTLSAGTTAVAAGGGADHITLAGHVTGDVQLGAGTDTLVLQNGAGFDGTIYGGAGADSFVFQTNAGSHVIADYETGVDQIDLSHFIANADTFTFTLGAQSVTGVSCYTDAELGHVALHLVQVGDDVALYYVTNGKAAMMAGAEPLLTLEDVTLGDLTLDDFAF